MIRYLSLIQVTDKGARNVDKLVQRASGFGMSVRDAGGKLVLQVGAVRQYDGCLVFEVPDEAVGSALLVKLAKNGNVRTPTMRCYDNQEFETVLKVAS